MADSSRPDLIVAESPKAELERRLERISSRALSVAEEAFEIGPECPTPEELASWTPRRRKLYGDANKCRSEMPGYLDFALRYNEAVNRKEQGREGARVNVHVEKAVIHLPERAAVPSEDDVKHISMEALRPDESDE